MDEVTIMGGLLHDVVEDTPYTEEDMNNDFGEEVALLVEGVTKLASLKFESKEERQAENLRRMFLAMSKDIRVLIIKLSDRLHNLRTINYMSEEKIREKCRETLDIYAPLASRLGIYAMKMEMEDIAMKHLYPEAYEQIATALNAKKAERNAAIDRVISDVKESLEDLHIKYEIYGRSKHFYSIFKKMQYQKKNIDEIFDLMAIRIIVDSIRDCYAVLGVVHTMWTPIPGRFKDYIAMPKPNMYQSIHTTVMGDEGMPFEIQIRTYEMHHIAEYGIAAHWKYKEGKTDGKSSNDEVKLSWLRQALEWQQETNDPTEFMESLKVDLFSGQVFVFTPKGDVIDLPAQATPLDFAFKIHSDVGAKCIGAKVNGKMVPIDHTLENGDIIEIMTNPNSSGPSIDWLKIAKSSNARAKIRQWLKKENKTDNIDRGKEQLDRYLRRKNLDPKELMKNSYIARAAKELGFSKPDELFAQIENGGTLLNKVMGVLTGYLKADQEEEKKKEENLAENLVNAEKPKQRKFRPDEKVGVQVRGAEGMDSLLIRMSKCCNPVPGDDIIGYITKGRGISVHRKDCVNITTMPENEKGRLIEVDWVAEGGGAYDAEITIESDDRRGLFSDISKVCDTNDVAIVAVNTHGVRGEVVTIHMTLAIKDTEQLAKLVAAFRMVRGVSKVYRSRA
jgi:GTP pyrophosphokinase